MCIRDRCSNASDLPGWKKPPPPYIRYFDVSIPYDSDGVASPSIFPPLSVFHPHVDIVLDPHVSGQDPQVYEDASLFLRARLPEDLDILQHMHLTEWKDLFDWANLDSLEKIRLLGGLAKRLLSLDMILHWELRQSVEAYLGHVLHAIALGTYNVPQFYISDAFRAIGIQILPGDDADESVGALKFTELDHHVAKGFRIDRFAITDRWGKCREFDDSSKAQNSMPNGAITCVRKLAAGNI